MRSRRNGIRPAERLPRRSTLRRPVPFQIQRKRGLTSMPELERDLSYSQALNEALREEMRRDPGVFVMGEDIAVWGDGGGVFGVTKGLVSEFGAERIRDTPMSEEGIVALG